MRDKTIKDKLWHVIAILTFIMLTVFTVTYAFWQVYPYKVSSIQQPIKILNKNKQVAIGESIIQELHINKPNNAAPIDVSRTILCEDGNLVTLSPNVATNLPIGEYTLINDKYVLLPKVAIGAKCIFVWRQSYQVNPIKKIPVEWRSETFTVVKE